MKKPWQWKWLIAQDHIGLRGKILIKLENLFNYIDIKKEQWKELILDNQEGVARHRIKQHLSTGRPLGNKRFIT